MSGNFIGILGIAVILGIAYLLSTNRQAIKLRVVGAAFGLQAVIAAFVIYVPLGQRVIDTMSTAVMNVMAYSRDGISSAVPAPVTSSRFGVSRLTSCR